MVMSVGISTLTICQVAVQFGNGDPTSFYGWVIATLAILVTLLIGWNIYSIVDLKGINRRFDSLKKDYDEQIRQTMVSTYYNMYLIFDEETKTAGKITSLIVCLKWMFRNAEDEKDNIKRMCEDLNKLQKNMESITDFGTNNMKILEESIPEILSNNHYKSHKGDFGINTILFDIMSRINKEKK